MKAIQCCCAVNHLEYQVDYLLTVFFFSNNPDFQVLNLAWLRSRSSKTCFTGLLRFLHALFVAVRSLRASSLFGSRARFILGASGERQRKNWGGGELGS